VDDRPDDFALARIVLARARREGLSFDEAWPQVFRCSRRSTSAVATDVLIVAGEDGSP
jgi:hypothetical protein